MSGLKAFAAAGSIAVLVIVLVANLHSQTPAPTPTPTTAPFKAPATQSVPGIPCLSHYEARMYKDPDGKTLLYRLLKPAKADPKTAYPLVVFLHGSGERGDENTNQLKLGISELFGADYTMRKYPCYLIAPQCPADSTWTNQRNLADTKPTQPMALTIELIAQLRKDYNIDPGRIYIIGLSMGGFGVWQCLANYPDLFAAGVPICGAGDPRTAEKFAKVPVWAFHGDSDPNVPVRFSRDFVAAMKKAGGDPQYTEYPGVKHSSWTNAFGEPKLLEWMFAQKKEAATSKPASQPA